MKKFLKEFKEKGTISFKYFGNEDLATRHELECVIENFDFYKKFFAECKLEKIETMEDYCRYFLCAKYEQFEEFVPCVRDEFKNIIRDIAEKTQKSIENLKKRPGEVIKFINGNIEKIFESKLDVWNIKDVTLDFIEKYKKGIKKETYKWLSEKRAWALLDRFESFGDIFDKYPDIFDNIFRDADQRNETWQRAQGAAVLPAHFLILLWGLVRHSVPP